MMVTARYFEYPLMAISHASLERVIDCFCLARNAALELLFRTISFIPPKIAGICGMIICPP